MNPPHPSPEKIKILLLGMLNPMRENQEALLHGDIDSQAVAKSAWDDFIPSLSDQEAQDWRDWSRVETALSNEVSLNLCPQELHSTPHHVSNTSSLSQWLKHLVDTLKKIDQRSLEILALLFEGYTPRDISEHLDIGLRCLQSIYQEMQIAWFKPPFSSS